MTLPPKGDRQRPVRLAARSAWSVGAVCLVLGGGAVVWTLATGSFGIKRVLLPLLMPFFIPGAIYLICSIFLARRHAWAILTAMTIAGLHTVIAGFVIGILLSSIAEGRRDTWVALVIAAAMIGGLGHLEYRLARVLEAVRKQERADQHGFEPLPPARVMPIVATPGGPDDQPVAG